MSNKIQKYKLMSDGTYVCLKCGKIIKDRNGFMPHSAWHKRKDCNLQGKDCKYIQKHIDTYDANIQ